MTDREKVIKGLELCEIGSGDRCYETECPYYGQGCTESLKNDILAMLKEQEAKQVNISQMHCGIKYGLCPRCEKQIDTLANPHYCGNCGQELKWE